MPHWWRNELGRIVVDISDESSVAVVTADWASVVIKEVDSAAARGSVIEAANAAYVDLERITAKTVVRILKNNFFFEMIIN